MKIREIQDRVRGYEQALKMRPKFQKVLDELQHLINEGKTHLNYWRQIYEIGKREPELIDVATLFFLYTAKAHLHTATLQAAKLIEDHKDSINLCYFFHVLLKEGRKHFPKNWQEVKNSALVDQKEITNLQKSFERVKYLRDKVIAHYDRDAINCALDEKSNVDVIELESLFKSVEKYLHKYYKYYNGQSLSTENDLSTIGIIVGVDDLFYLVRKGLDGESLEGSESLKNVQSLRKAKLKVNKFLNQAQDTE